ncbi:MAG: rRNA cytosine-C5-methylase, partial [Pseudomonadota bacterium]
MMPSARVQAALEILTALGGSRLPADRMLADYFRSRRYAGSKDRSFVVDIVYGVLRHQARLDWWVYRALGDLSSALIAERARVIAFLHLAQGRTTETVRGLFDGSQYGAKSLNTTERELLSGLEKLEVGDHRSITHPDQPSWVSLEYPEWLDDAFRAQFGDDLGREMAAAREEARLELRVNTLKADVQSAQVALEAEGVETTPTALSPIGLVSKGRPP